MDTTYAVMDMWSAQLMRYAAAVGLVVVLYDYLLTIEDEVCLLLCASGLSQFAFFDRSTLFGGEAKISQKSCTTLIGT